MSLPLRHVAVLGVDSDAVQALVEGLRAMPVLQDVCVSDRLPADPGACLALLVGLDSPSCDTDVARHPMRLGQEHRLREQLLQSGWPHRVVHGPDRAERLTQALFALGLPPQDDTRRLQREQAQFDLNRGRTRWTCESCSDPDCEHRLFSGLLRQRPLGA